MMDEGLGSSNRLANYRVVWRAFSCRMAIQLDLARLHQVCGHVSVRL
jgi:hypothetical protein